MGMDWERYNRQLKEMDLLPPTNKQNKQTPWP